MDNHYHLLVETPEANISQTMQNINTSYTVYTNKKHGKSGHLFQGRYKGIVVDKDSYLVTLSRYIHLNPVRAAMVQKPEDYRWSSYSEYIGRPGENTLADTADTLSLFSQKARQAAQAYRDFVTRGIEDKETPFDDLEAGILLGPTSFKDRIRALLDARAEDEEMPQMKLLKSTLPIDRVIRSCCRHYGKEQDELLGKRSGQRAAAIYLAKILSRRKNIEIGHYFGIKGPAVSNAIKEMEGRIDKEHRMRSEIETLQRMIINEE